MIEHDEPATLFLWGSVTQAVMKRKVAGVSHLPGIFPALTMKKCACISCFVRLSSSAIF